MKRYGPILSVLICLVIVSGCTTHGFRKPAVMTGPMMQWHVMTLTFDKDGAKVNTASAPQSPLHRGMIPPPPNAGAGSPDRTTRAGAWDGSASQAASSLAPVTPVPYRSA